MEKLTDGAPVPERVQCSACEQEVPTSEALSPEASDYVAYFCGFACYARWRERSIK